MNIHLLVIDPQNDFCDPQGSLYVPGAERDIERVARLVERMRGRLTQIHVTLDSHRKVDISHPMWFKSSSGKHPDPFTVIGPADLETGVWSTTRPSAHARTLEYLRALETGGRYPHVVWPYHCLIGDEGHNVSPKLAAAVHAWEDRFAMADFVTKGSNPWTEHFSAVQAEVPDPSDPTTQINSALIETLEQADIVLLAGEALSHCLANTVRDIADKFQSPEFVEKLVLLTDASSNVPGFESYGENFVQAMTKKGMRLSTTESVLAEAA